MYVKIKTLLHAFAAVLIFFLTDSFCCGLVRAAVLIRSPVIFLPAWYACLSILNVWTAVFLYARHVLRAPLSEIYLGKPFPDLRWCMAAAAVPLAADVIYFIFTKGEFHMGCHTKDELCYILFHEVLSSGLRAAVTEGMLFWGLLLRILQKGLGNKAGIPVCGLIYAAAGFIFHNRFDWRGAGSLGMFLLTFLMGTAFALITCAAGSIWLSVVIHFWYNTLSGSAYILHMDARQDFPAIFTYTVESESIFSKGLWLPETAVFLTLIGIMLVIMKKEDRKE